MKLLLTFLFSFILVFTNAQSKLVKKSDKLFKKGKYEKCIERSQKSLKKERRSAELQYYIVASQLALYEEASEKRKYTYLKKSINAWKKLSKYNQANHDYSELNTNLIQSIYIEISAETSNQGIIEAYHLQLAELFLDTTDYFRSVNEIPMAHHGEENLGPVYDSIVLLSEFRNTIIEEARNVIGVKYKYGGTDSTGFDCSGFIQYLYKSVGIDLPHNAHLQSKMGETVSLEEAQAGDLIFFGTEKRIGHAGMIYQNKQGEIELIHCASRGVTYQKNDDPNTIYWLNFVVRVQRLIHEGE